MENTTEPIVNAETVIVQPSEEKVARTYDNTIFKSSYWYNKYLCQMFFNFGVGGHNSFSVIVKKGKTTLVHNLVADEKLNFVRAVLSKLTPEELAIVLKA